VARGDATPASDIELLVDFDPARRGLDLFAFARELAGMLGRRVDVGTEVHSIIRDKVDALDLAHIDEAATRIECSAVHRGRVALTADEDLRDAIIYRLQTLAESTQRLSPESRPEFRSYVIVVGMKRWLTCVNAGVVVLCVVPTGLLRWASVGCGEPQEPWWFGDLEGAEDVALAGVELGALVDVAGVAGELAHVQGPQFLTQASPGVSGYLVLGDPDEQQRQPAQQDVGADAFFLAVVDRTKVQVGLHVPPAALHFQELLVAGGDVLGRQRRVGAAQQPLAVQPGLATVQGGVHAQQPGGGDAQVPVQAGYGGDLAAQLGRVLRIPAAELARHRVRPGSHLRIVTEALLTALDDTKTERIAGIEQRWT